MLLRINYFRAMAGVPDQVTFSSTYSGKSQQAALMMSVNGQLSHSPPSTWTCYTADGATAAGSSNLALGTYGRSSVNAYMKDSGSNNTAAGHRRWILYPQTQNMGTGDIPPDGGYASNSLWVFDSHMWETRPPVRDSFVAWPPPGYVPYQVVYPRWSFSYPSADFSAASVTMTQGGQNVPVALETVANGYGENTLVWIPNGMSNSASWPQPAFDTFYTVTVSNVFLSGSPRAFTYDVAVMDPAQVIKPAPAGDFTGDGKADLLWRHTTAGDVWVWLMDGPTPKTGGQVYFDRVDPAYVVKGVGDLTGDFKADIVWHHGATGEVWVWPMNGTTRLDQVWAGRVPDTGYRIQGVADFTGDGKADLLWHHAARGEVWMWEMDGVTRLSETWVATVPETDYQVAATGDYDGDGKADLLWHHATRGEVWMWEMDGVTRLSETWVATVPDVGYQIVK